MSEAMDPAAVRALRQAGRHDEHLAAARALAAACPSVALARLEAAFALDTAGDEVEAVRHYDAAWQLGVPAADRRRFLVGYGATLRNVGRGEQATVLLTEELAADPGYLPYVVFLALALHSSGHPSAALAALLGGVLELADRCASATPEAGHPLDGYQRALGGYYQELLDASTSQTGSR